MALDQHGISLTSNSHRQDPLEVGVLRRLAETLLDDGKDVAIGVAQPELGKTYQYQRQSHVCLLADLDIAFWFE